MKKIASLHEYLEVDCELQKQRRDVFIALYHVTNGRPCDDCAIRHNCKERHDLEIESIASQNNNTIQHETNAQIAERMGITKRQASKMRKAGLL